MFNNMCGPTNKEHEWHEGRPSPKPMTSGCFPEQLGPVVPSLHIMPINHEHSQSYRPNNIMYSHHYINDSPSNSQSGNNEWQYIQPTTTPTRPARHYLDSSRSKPTNREDSAKSSPSGPTTDMHIDSGNTNKTYLDSDVTPYQQTEMSTMYPGDRCNFQNISKSDGRMVSVGLSSTLLNSEPCLNSDRWAKCESNVNTSSQNTIPLDHEVVLESNLSRFNVNEVIKKKCKNDEVVSSADTCRNELCDTSRTNYQNNVPVKAVREGPSEDEDDEDNLSESCSGGDSDGCSLSSGVSKINCRDARTEISVMKRDEEGPSEESVSCDNTDRQQIDSFYKFVCAKCVSFGGKKLTFSSHKLLTEHCHEKHGSEGEIKCCGQSMWLREELLEHMQEHTNLIWCDKCQKSFANKTALKKHMNEHIVAKTADVGPYGCPRCDKKFSSKYGLTNHLNLHLPEDERPFKCRHCNKGFGAKHAMSKHERTHLPDEERLSYVCDKCGKRFGYASTLDGHQKHVHQNERPFVCHICAKTFPIKGALTYHLTTHEVQERVQCSDCGIWLKNEKILRIHKKCHRGDSYACPHCDKVSNTRNNLRMHMKRHSDARPHPCPLCARAFKTPRDLKTHMVQHTGQKPYSCPYCPKTFASPSNFYAHRKMKHKMAAPVYEDPPPQPIISNVQSY